MVKYIVMDIFKKLQHYILFIFYHLIKVLTLLQLIRRNKILTLFIIGPILTISATIGKPPASVYAVIAVDTKDASILYQHNAQIKTPPASLTKLMTLLMVFDALDQKRIKLTDCIPVSKRAVGQAPCKLGMHTSTKLTVQDVIFGLITKSANDAACAVAEFLAGSESNFARHMTKRAADFGMKNTVFKNASGLPATGQITTAEDMAILGLITHKHYKRHFHVFKTPRFCFQKKCHINHNYRLLSSNKFYFHGIKTGYTNKSRFNVISSHTNKHKQDIIIVVLGGASPALRDKKVLEIAAKIEHSPYKIANPSRAPNNTHNLSLGCYASKLRAENVLKQALSYIKTKSPPKTSTRKIQSNGRTLYQAVLVSVSEEDQQHISGVLSYFHIPCEKTK